MSGTRWLPQTLWRSCAQIAQDRGGELSREVWLSISGANIRFAAVGCRRKPMSKQYLRAQEFSPAHRQLNRVKTPCADVPTLPGRCGHLLYSLLHLRTAR